MKFVQILTTLSSGDAVGNDCLAISNYLEKQGKKTIICAEHISGDLISKRNVYTIDELDNIRKDDIVLYHLSMGTELNRLIKQLPGKKIMIYHNITPDGFFREYNLKAAALCEQGRRQVESLNNTFDFVIADSEYNKQELVDMGFRSDQIDVLPILIPFRDYDRKWNRRLLRNLRDGKKNIVFVGRVAPNKKQEDIIRAFSIYKKYYEKESRLLLVGSYGGMERYYERLKGYIDSAKIDDVFITGHVSFCDILSYYRAADLFLCMSEHEGFCVPLVEAMYFDVPIIAYDSSAIKETLGGAGVLLDDKKAEETAGMMNRVIMDEKLRSTILDNQRERLKDFKQDVIYTRLDEILRFRGIL